MADKCFTFLRGCFSRCCYDNRNNLDCIVKLSWKCIASLSNLSSVQSIYNMNVFKVINSIIQGCNSFN